jgi:hypothetical protein
MDSSKFSEHLLALNHLFKDSSSISISFLKPPRLELVNIILVSSANKTGLLIVFYKSFYLKKKK